MGDSPIAGASAHASSGLGGAAATGDGDLMTQVGISAMSSAFVLCTNIGIDTPLHNQCNFFVLHIKVHSPAITVTDPRKEAIPGEAISITVSESVMYIPCLGKTCSVAL